MRVCTFTKKIKTVLSQKRPHQHIPSLFRFGVPHRSWLEVNSSLICTLFVSLDALLFRTLVLIENTRSSEKNNSFRDRIVEVSEEVAY